ncbi:uncharacterized protein LOC142639621 [Castanea sativa]|uniref:uncharacterized protein LOC142639621 n=1 Tax=Castanea sativa TaxID=21020 RepID=UPI003F64926A
MECSLSREEKDELARSKKKVKDANHAGFCEDQCSGPASPSHDEGSWKPNVSFRDKVVGEILGAFSQAFRFEDVMDDDAESDGEVETLQQGLLSVKLSREFKQKICKPWARAFIVKVYGRNVGLNFIQAKLLALWKPAGRLDCVDLGHGFFLTRLSLGEDYENVLRKGPWFIEEHFLSIRPWEPDFKPALASVSSIVVWVRLNELPIEYYNAEALQLIGKAISNVLRVDTFTASETRGRFARICVQVDVEKPLATAIMIGRLEQQICYEGIHKLCFGCGRLGHRKEQCPYIIRQEPAASEMRAEKCKVVAGSEQYTGQVDVHDSMYGPWIVVACRKNGTKLLKSGGTSPRQNSGFSFKDNGNMGKESLDRAVVLRGPSRDVKRNLSPPKLLDRAQIAAVVQSIRSEGSKQAQFSPNLELKSGDAYYTSTQPKSDHKTQRLSSMKGKKGAARSVFSMGEHSSAVGGKKSSSAMFSQPKVIVEPMGKDGQCSKTEASMRADGFQFTAAKVSLVDIQGQSSGKSDLAHEVTQMSNQGRDSSKSDPIREVVQLQMQESTEGYMTINGDKCEEGEAAILSFSLGSPCAMQCEAIGGDGDGGFPAYGSFGFRSRPDKGGVEAERMDLEGGGGIEEPQGSSKPSFKKCVRELVQNHNQAILVVMETRVRGDRAREITNLLPFDEAIHTDATSYAGGLWVLWNADRVDITLLSSTEQEIHAEVKKAKEWNKNQFGNIFTRKRNLMSRLNGIQRALALRPSDFLVKLDDELLRELDLVLRQEEELWALKSRVNWMIQGDRNTNFYHVSTWLDERGIKSWLSKMQ